MKLLKNEYENACNLPFNTQDKQKQVDALQKLYQQQLEYVADLLMTYFKNNQLVAPQMNMGGRTI